MVSMVGDIWGGMVLLVVVVVLPVNRLSLDLQGSPENLQLWTRNSTTFVQDMTFSAGLAEADAVR
jgi:hypothetical protein